MKTPKRKYQGSFLEYGAETHGILSLNKMNEYTRWKRKNRIAQLKRSLHRYRDATNLPFYCHEWHAYKLLQELNRPTERATAEKWQDYIFELSRIYAYIDSARMWAYMAMNRKKEEESACLAKTAENAKQSILTCTDAEQLTNRKGN